MTLIIDTDTHVTEPLDLWTSRLPAKWADQAPHAARDPNGMLRWRVGQQWVQPVGLLSVAGWPEYFPSFPPTLDEADPACFDAAARLQRMDEYGIHAAVLYPNLIAFETYAFLELEDAQLRLACVRASNDWLAEFAHADRSRLVPIAMLPFWDVDECVREMERCKDRGHAGILWALPFDRIGLPHGTDPYWDRVYAAAQSLELSVNLHAAIATTTQQEWAKRDAGLGFWQSGDTMSPQAVPSRTRQGAFGQVTFLVNAQAIADLVSSGVCERFPRLDFVSVESGFGYVPYLLDLLDWNFQNRGGSATHAVGLPSEVFRRQIYVTFWFERSTLSQLEQYPDNVMYSTDFPHPTSVSPGAASPALVPSEFVDRQLHGVPDAVRQKVLYDTAARLYRIGR